MDKTRVKKVALIYEFLSEQGGLEREIINHAKFLIDAGYEVEILTGYLDKKILSLLPFDNIPIKVISKLNTRCESLNLILCFLGFNNLKEHNADIFISYSAPCNFLLRKKTAKKVDYINHFPHFLYLSGKEKIEWAASTQGLKRWISVFLSWITGWRLKKIDRNLVKKNDLNFSNSQFTKKRIDKIYDINSIVSYPPVDPRFKPSSKSLKEKFIFSSSRIIPDKKYEWLIESVSYMENKLPLYVAGSVEKNYKAKLASLAEKFKVNLKFLGRLNTIEIVDYYTNAQVFAFPAPEEDFGLVPAESLSCGTPVVVWGDNSGPTEQIINGTNGFHAQPYDLKDFARKLDLCIDNKIKSKNKQKILASSKKFSANELKKDFLKQIAKLTPHS